MNWKFWKTKEEVVKARENKLNPKIVATFEVGDKFIDKRWGDTIVKVTAISRDKIEVRYIFLQIDGKKIITNSPYTTTVSYLLSTYLPYKEEENA